MDTCTKIQPETAIQAWLITKLSEWTAIPEREIDIREPFAGYGLSSVAAVSLSGQLQDWLGLDLSPILAYEYPTIESLAHYLADEAACAQLAASTARAAAN